MARDSALNVPVGIIAAIMICVAAAQASDVFAPLALALFIIALVWPLQSWLRARMPALLALAVTMTVTVAVCIAFASLVAWGFGRVGVALFADTARYQALYERAIDWLDDRGISVAGLWSEHFNVGWLVQWAGQITGRVNTTLSFWLIALLYVILGLMEVDDLRWRAKTFLQPETSRILLQGTAATAVKLRKYMEVRTLMSIATGALVGAFAWVSGLNFALEWGVIAFALNYIPFIGPFIATLFPTLLAMAQFASWEAVVGVFVCLNIIQFVVGSYIEPRLSGAVLAMSPSVVLFAVFFWTFIWGLFGAFIGVPIAIAILTFSSYHPSSRWVADLLGGPMKKKSLAQS
ncbi:MAG TPA: AI-2E family transporter [Roseiarcus sp.]|nr:AI-2E family transporter [Roseiarcus sp.]